MPKLFSYIVARDYGFAPNPFYGFCTLATCKPRIRESASKGDWIAGTGSKKNNRDGYLVYAMRVTEAMSFDEYWNDPRFARKKPDLYASQKKAFGDNIYYREDYSNGWCQRDSHHSYADGTTNFRNVEKDTRVNRLLVSEDFIYWGGSGPLIPDFQGMSICHTTQHHRCRFSMETVETFVEWIRSLGEEGYCGSPLDW